MSRSKGASTARSSHPREGCPTGDVLGFLAGFKDVERVAMEASTSMMTLYRELKLNGYNALISHPKKTRLIAESQIKTDPCGQRGSFRAREDERPAPVLRAR
jgi:hypothetical protein